MNDEIRNQLLAIIGEEANIDVEIDQTLYPKPDWATHQIVRASGLVEDICEHGVGHPNISWLKIHDKNGDGGFGIHGCCKNLCCFDEDTKKRIKREIKENRGEQ